jgi:hypothetical protein
MKPDQARRRAEEAISEAEAVALADQHIGIVATKEDFHNLCKAAIAAALLKLTQGQEVVLTSNYGRIVKVEVAGVTHFEVDLSPRSYFEVCWSAGWGGTYSSREEAEEECFALCGYSRAIREVKPSDAGYKDHRHLNLKEQRIAIPGQQEERVRELEAVLASTRNRLSPLLNPYTVPYTAALLTEVFAAIDAARNKEQGKCTNDRFPDDYEV